jgi:hypothetical protein
MADNRKHYDINTDLGAFKIVPADGKIIFTPKQAYEGYEMIIKYPKSWTRGQIFMHVDTLISALEQTNLF